MGYLYLIGETDSTDTYKIGVTRKNNINERKRELQTGNSTELYIRYTYETENPYKLEKMLHRHYFAKHKFNEWFTLTELDAKEFINTCKKYDNIINSLKDNPFYNRKSS